MNADADAPIHDVTTFEMSMFSAAGGMISTPGDLNTFLAALLTGQLLPDAELMQMLTTRETKN